MAKKDAASKTLGADGATIAAMASQKLLQDTYGPQVVPELDIPADAPPAEEATEFMVLKDVTLPTVFGGNIRFRRGQIVKHPHIVSQLKRANIELKPVR